MRTLYATAVSLALGVFVSVADEKRPLPPDVARAQRLKELESRFDEEIAELKGRLEQAKTDKERQGLLTEARETASLITDKLCRLIEDDPKDDVAVRALELIVRKTGFGDGRQIGRAALRVAEQQIDHPRIKALLPDIPNIGAAGESFLATVAEKSADREARGLALFLLGAIVTETANYEDDPAKQEGLIRRASDYLERAAQEAPDYQFRGGKIAELAAAELDGLKQAAALLVGKPAPDIESLTLDGQVARLSASRGKVVLLDFWATTCGPCRSMIPHARKLVKRMEGRPFELINVSGDPAKETLVQFLAREPMPWTHWWKNGVRDRAFEVYRVYSYPTVFLIDHTGIIRARWKTPPPPAELDKLVDELVKAAEK